MAVGVQAKCFTQMQRFQKPKTLAGLLRYCDNFFEASLPLASTAYGVFRYPLVPCHFLAKNANNCLQNKSI
jgi:hypothetical protein